MCEIIAYDHSFRINRSTTFLMPFATCINASSLSELVQFVAKQ